MKQTGIDYLTYGKIFGMVLISAFLIFCLVASDFGFPTGFWTIGFYIPITSLVMFMLINYLHNKSGEAFKLIRK